MYRKQLTFDISTDGQISGCVTISLADGRKDGNGCMRD